MQSASFSRPKDEPTLMLFYMQRLKLATVSREVVDTLLGSSITLEPDKVPYDKIVGLDAKFGAILDDFPKPLRLDMSSESLRQEYGAAFTEKMALSRAVVNVFVYSRRCRLHLPFLIRVRSDSRYAYSRETCLEGARKIFQVRHTLRADVSAASFAAFFRQGSTLSHFFYAAVVLVMDLCVNKKGDQQHLAEVHDAIKAMEEAKASSGIAANLLESLFEVLRKHQINLPSASHVSSSAYTVHKNPDAMHADGPMSISETQFSANAPPNDVQMLSDGVGFDDIWHDYLYNGGALDPRSWDALINELEGRMA